MTRRAVLGKIKTALQIGVSGWVFSILKELPQHTTPVEVGDVFRTWADVQLVPGSHHPVDGYHPDIRIAMELLAPLVPRSDLVVAVTADALPDADLRRDLLLIGGPISNSHSLKLHGYQFATNKISGVPTRNTGFRWCFYYRKRHDGTPEFRRFVGGKLRATMPKALLDRHAIGDMGLPRYCDIDEDTQRIKSDFLLLTVVPNDLNEYSTGSTIIDVADLQGQGDKTFATIVRDSGCRKELARAPGRNRYFQALFSVPVTHSDERSETKPGTPSLIGVHLLG